MFLSDSKYVSEQNETCCMCYNTWTTDLHRVKQHTGRLTKALFIRRTALGQEHISDPSSFQFFHKMTQALRYSHLNTPSLNCLSLCSMNSEIEATLLPCTGTHLHIPFNLKEWLKRSEDLDHCIDVWLLFIGLIFLLMKMCEDDFSDVELVMRLS